MVLHNVVVQGAAGRPLLMDLYVAPKTSGMVLFLHGFKGFKDWGPFSLVARAFQQAGLTFVKFNFSHNGTTLRQPTEFADLDAFGRNNPLLELEDTRCVMQYVFSWWNHHRNTTADTLPVFVVGHSRGGALALLFGSREKNIRRVVTWAAVKGFGTLFSDQEIARWKQEGVRYELNQRTGQMMPMYFQYWETLQNHRAELDVCAAVRQADKPILALHGSDDASVPVDHAHAIKACNPQQVQLEILDGGDHTFGGKHPWTQEHLPELMARVVGRTLQFLLEGQTAFGQQPAVFLPDACMKLRLPG